MDRIRILIADDHPVFRFGLRALINIERDMEVVGEAGTGDEAIALASSLEPHVILMDLKMPGIEGIQATRQILRQQPQVNILVITGFDDDSVFAAMDAGAKGYLLKGAEGEDTLRAIRAAAHGEGFLSPSTYQRVRARVAHLQSDDSAQAPDELKELTDRELDILKLMAQGLTNDAIAARLPISAKTVRNIVSAIYDKLGVTSSDGVTSRDKAITKARKAGLVK